MHGRTPRAVQHPGVREVYLRGRKARGIFTERLRYAWSGAPGSWWSEPAGEDSINANDRIFHSSERKKKEIEGLISTCGHSLRSSSASGPIQWRSFLSDRVDQLRREYKREGMLRLPLTDQSCTKIRKNGATDRPTDDRQRDLPTSRTARLNRRSASSSPSL